MKRIAAFTLLIALSVAWSVPTKAQGTGAAEYARQTQKANKKQQKMNKRAAKQQRKTVKKYQKAQRKAAKKQRKAAKKYQKAR
ncbi:MAG TPA: hypothetical protein VED66_02365 [Candidatus Sulfotelmatobacter sp.]|nr:hypothetical protein [Candidatus Sulfotelmatobacter sp.]